MALSDLKQTKCKTCGEPLDSSAAADGVIRCAVCGSCFTLPKEEAPRKVLDYLFQAEGDLDTGRFDEAYTKYSKAAELDKTEPEAYWGMALAEFKIQYLKDEVNNRLQPICHEINGETFCDGANFLKAIRYATNAQRKEYERKCEEIDRIKKEFYNLKKRGLDYDCFICVKVTDEYGGRTEDGDFAHKLYRMLKNNSFEPFYSEAVLKTQTGTDYEAHILYALTTAETMLVVCFDEAYLRTKWVKNEYTRFLRLVNDEEKESDGITVIYRGKPIEKLPGKRGKIQGIDADELDCPHRILQFVESHTPEAKRRREEIAASKTDDSADLRKKLAEQDERFKQLEAMLKAQQGQTVQPQLQPQKTEPPVQPRPAPAPGVKRPAVKPAPANSSSEFEITGGVLKKYKGNSRSVVVPTGVREIANYAFNNCGMESVEFLGKVKKIGNYAFNNCANLKTVGLPDGLQEIDNYAFNNCSSLESIIIPATVTEISSYAFNNCIGLKEVAIGKGVNRIGRYAFSNCARLRAVTLPARFEGSLSKIFGENGGRCRFDFID